MRSGAISRRVELWKKQVTKNNFGEYIETWEKDKDLRAYSSSRRGRQTEANDEIFDSIVIDITVRNQHDIEEKDRIKLVPHGRGGVKGNNYMYQIEHIQPDPITYRWIKLRCTRINE